MRRNHVWIVAMIAAMVVAAGCTPQGHSYPEGDRAALEAKAGGWIDSFNAGDAEAIAALHSLDAKLFPPNMPPVNGRSDIQAFWQGFMDTGLKGELHIDELDVGGNLGTRVGSYKVLGADGTVMDEGRFVEIWKYVGGEWHFHRDIWNSDLPLPADEEAMAETD
jgi:ketosteroid isomerase-like protein